MRKRIAQLGTTLRENHRADFETCPHCQRRFDADKWDSSATTLILSPSCYKSGCVAIVSECPSCFEPSWVHQSMSCVRYLSQWPEKWRNAVEKREAVVKLQALRDWGSGICHRCVHLESGKVEHNAWRSCVIGTGPPRPSCEKFEPIPEVTQ